MSMRKSRGKKRYFYHTVHDTLRHSMLLNEHSLLKKKKKHGKNHLIDVIELQKSLTVFCNMKNKPVITAKCCRYINTELFNYFSTMDLLLPRAAFFLHLPVSEMCQKQAWIWRILPQDKRCWTLAGFDLCSYPGWSVPPPPPFFFN